LTPTSSASSSWSGAPGELADELSEVRDRLNQLDGQKSYFY